MILNGIGEKKQIKNGYSDINQDFKEVRVSRKVFNILLCEPTLLRKEENGEISYWYAGQKIIPDFDEE